MAENNEWGNNLSFIFAMIGSAVGLGNIWRYPYVLYSSGGGAFLIPYLVAIFILGIPFLILEYAVGYNFKASFAKGLRKINKHFEFLGWLLPLGTFCVMIYYSAVIGYIAIYIVLSFYRGWTDNPKTFFESTLLKATDSPSGIFNFIPVIAIAMIICWVLIWIISHKQLEKGLGKVNKILVPILFLIMLGIVVYSMTLDGASIGLRDLFVPKWSSLLNGKIWMSAFGQIVFSLSVGFGMAFTYAGYAGKGTDLITNAITIVVANCGFENFCALGVFSILGYMAKIQGVGISKVVEQGTGLVFVAYPAVINVLGKFSYVIGPAFFITVFLAGLTSILSMIEPLSFCIQNKFNCSRGRAATVLIIIAAVFSMLFSTGFGGTLLGYVDSYINNVLILLCIILQCFIYAWVFKVKDTMKTLNDRSKTIKVGLWWIIIVRFALPICIALIWYFGIVDLIENGSIVQTIVFIILTVVLFTIAGIFTFLKPTNESWEETENRL